MNSHPKFMGHIEGRPEREVHSNTGLPNKERNISSEQTNPTSTRTGRRTTKTPQRKQKVGNKQN